MRISVSRIRKTLGRRLSTLSATRQESLDETLLFSEEQIRFLADRGVIYLTERPDGRYSTIIAHDHGMAARIADRRGTDEKVVGLMGKGFFRHLRASVIQPHANDGPRSVNAGVLVEEGLCA